MDQIRGQIMVKFVTNKEPQVEFLGTIDPLDIQAMIYKIRMGYQLGYLAKRGEDLQRKAAEVAKEQAEANTKKEVTNGPASETNVSGTNGSAQGPSVATGSGIKIGFGDKAAPASKGA